LQLLVVIRRKKYCVFYAYLWKYIHNESLLLKDIPALCTFLEHI
jgi:hypothetical protein